MIRNLELGYEFVTQFTQDYGFIYQNNIIVNTKAPGDTRGTN